MRVTKSAEVITKIPSLLQFFHGRKGNCYAYRAWQETEICLALRCKRFDVIKYYFMR